MYRLGQFEVQLASSQHGALGARVAVWLSISTWSCSEAGERWDRMVTRTQALLGKHNARRQT